MIQCVRWPKATHIVSDVIWLRAKKLSKIFFFFLIITLSFSLSASAHSGRTDGNGGHYNRSTGEYHYHHGYPAHDHYDMDGNGTIDCPYDFKDQTNKDSEKASSATKDPVEPTAEKSPNSMAWVILGVVIVVSITFIVFKIADSRDKKKKEMRKENFYKRDKSIYLKKRKN